MSGFGFKVRDRVTGLFKSPGNSWSKVGKTWNRLQDLKSHLNLHHHSGRNPIRPQWEVIIMVPVSGTNIPLQQAVHLSEKELIDLAFTQHRAGQQEPDSEG